jgi:hypothetical protein
MNTNLMCLILHYTNFKIVIKFLQLNDEVRYIIDNAPVIYSTKLERAC